MEEKRLKIISTNKTIGIIILIVAIILGSILVIYNIKSRELQGCITETKGMTSITKIYTDTENTIPNNSNISTNMISAYIGGVSEESEGIKLDNIFVKSYEELENYLLKCFGKNYINIKVHKQDILKYFSEDFFENKKLAIFMHDETYSGHSYSTKSIIINNTTATINIEDRVSRGGILASSILLDCYILDKSIDNVQFDIYRTIYGKGYTPDIRMFFIMFSITIILIIILVTMHSSRYNKTVEGKLEKMDHYEKVLYGIISIVLISGIVFTSVISCAYLLQRGYTSSVSTVKEKPIIYLYPKEEKEISVELKNKENIICSYPKYTDGWKVLAKPNGDLKDIETGRNLYSLYYERKDTNNYEIEDEGFVIKGEDSAKFLEDKLAILGLNEREAEEFIIYWLPKLEANKYNYIRFATAEEIEENMPLEITPKPDTTIRIIMTFKGLDNPIQVKEQKLEKVERNGYTAVEWGGTEII